MNFITCHMNMHASALELVYVVYMVYIYICVLDDASSIYSSCD